MLNMLDFSKQLLAWYDVHRRILPWREDPHPYGIWIAEIMLQQTRVEAVTDHYRRFLQRFPSIDVLAAASEAEVLAHWQGLGYYSRARRLRETAKIVTKSLGGRLPMTKAELMRLPGIGDYTAAAIASIAYGQPEVALDGNLLRLGARYFALQQDMTAAAGREELRTRLQGLICPLRPGDFNQALMDLASSICLPKKPRCSVCPISAGCLGLLTNTAAELPYRRRPARARRVSVKVFLVAAPGVVLLRRRQTGSFLRGMWELPWQESVPEITSGDDLTIAEKAAGAYSAWWLPKKLELLPPAKTWRSSYLFSHIHWEIQAAAFHPPAAFCLGTDNPDCEYQWQLWNKLSALALPTVFRKLLAEYETGQDGELRPGQ